MGMFGFAEIIANLEHDARTAASSRRAIGSLLPTQGRSRRAHARPCCAARRSARSSACCRAAARCSPPSPPTRWRRSSPRIRRRFGKGAIEGVAGPESANNAGAQTSFIPLLTLGIPPTPVMALMVGAMMIQGIQPGPQVMTRAAGPVLGPDRLDVDRQPDAARAQPAADRHLGEAAARALPAPVPGDPAVLLHRRLQRRTTTSSTSTMAAASALLGYVFIKLGSSRRRCCSASCSGR